MQYIELDLAKNEAEIKSVDGELAKGNVGSVELHIINPPSDWVSGSVWATFSKGSTQISHLSAFVDSKYVTDVPAKMFEDDRNFGIFVWCIVGESYVETRRVARVSLAETGTIPATTEIVSPEEASEVMQCIQKMDTLYKIVDTAEKDRYQKYYKAEGLSEKEIASDDFESREMKFLRKEGDRQTAYGVAEKKRDDDYSGAESSRYNRYSSAEADRNGRYVVAETERRNLFDSAESERNSAESVRQTNEESRQSYEGQRRIAESNRKVAETERQSNEIERQEAEAQRENIIKSLSDVALSGDYKDLKNLPAVFDTYRPYYSNAVNSLGVKNAIDILVVPELNNKADSKDLSKVATSGSYNDLKDKPIIESISDNIPHDYNEFTTEGIYILREPYKERYKLLIVVTDNDHYDNETNTFYGYVVTQYLFSTYGVTKRMNIKDKWTKWDPVGGTDINVVDDIDNISGDDEFDAIPSARAVKIHVGFVQNEIIGYIDRAIGDVETSLENIIAKYGLGGDDV